MTTPNWGGGIRGLVPYPGDEVLADRAVIAGADHPRWFRVIGIRHIATGTMELHGWLIGREDLGEQGVSAPMTVPVIDPPNLVVRRAPGNTVPLMPPEPEPLPGPVQQLLAPGPRWPALPPRAAAALADPDRPVARGRWHVPKGPQDGRT